MGTLVSFNGTNYTVPASGERAWGAQVSAYLIAIASGSLQKTGGSFTLTAADVDFGATYGLKANKFASRTTPSTTGIFRLGNAESVAWRNAGNTADLALKVNASNLLEYGGNPILTLALGAANTAFRMNSAGTAYEWAALVNVNIDAGAAIDWSKISKTSSNLTDLATRSHTALSDIGTNTHAQIDTALSTSASHQSNTSNPHSVTATQLGLGSVDNTSDATKNAATVALTNKDYQGGTASNTSRLTVPSAAKATLDALTRKEATLAYATDLDLLYVDNGTSLVAVGSGSSGELNVVENPSDSINWAVTTAGTPMTVATTTTAGDLPLSSVIDTAIQITSKTAAGAETAEYVGYAFTTPASLNARLKVEFYMRTGSNFIASEWTVSVFATATRQVLSTDSSSLTYLPAANGKFTTTFDALPSTAYTLRFARPVNAGTNAGVLNIAAVVVGPGIQPQGAVVSEWTSFTPTWTTLNTPSASAGKWRRVGDSMEVEASVTNTVGIGSGSNTAITIPDSKTIDTTKVSNTAGAFVNFGSGSFYDVSTTDYIPFGVVYYSTTTVAMALQTIAGNYDTLDGTDLGDGDQIAIRFTVPIAEWAGSGTVNLAQNDVEYASNSDATTATSNTSSFIYGPSGNLIPAVTAYGTSISRTVQFQTAIQATDVLEVQIRRGTASDQWTSAVASGLGYVAQGSSSEYGILLSQTSSTQALVRFMKTGPAPSGATLGANSASDWEDLNVASYYWRVVKAKSGQAVGFGLATADRSGLVSAETSGSFTMTATGFTTTPTCNGYYTRVGNIVTIVMDADVLATSNATSFTLTGMPSILYPARTTDGSITNLRDNTGSYVAGSYRISTAGVITLYLLGRGSFTAAGTKGVLQNSFTYYVD